MPYEIAKLTPAQMSMYLNKASRKGGPTMKVKSLKEAVALSKRIKAGEEITNE